MLYALLVVVGAVVAREATRALVMGELRVRSIVAIRTPGSHTRRALTIASGLVVMYLAIAAVSFAYWSRYGFATGISRYHVVDVIAGGAAVGKLERGDVIHAFDGEKIFVGVGPPLTERVNARAGAPITLDIHRGGTSMLVRIEPRMMPGAEGKWLIGIRPDTIPERVRDRSRAAVFAFAYPIHHVQEIARGIGESLSGSDEPEVGLVVRITEEFRALVDQREVGMWLGLYYATHLLLLALLLDLVRLVVLIRDRVRA